MNRLPLWLSLAALLLVGAIPVSAQPPEKRAPADEEPAMLPDPAPIARTADVGSGQVGQRQTRETAVPDAMPLDRLSTRVTNRVQNRIRNRIDRYYDPQANATSPFQVAQDQARTTSPRRR